MPSEIPSPPFPLPSPECGDVILEADMPPRKKTCFTAPSHRFEIRESSAATVARQTRSALARGVDYGFIDTLDASIQATGERVMTALEEVNDRMINLAATHRYESEEFYTRHQDAQDDRALLQACISTLEREPMAMEARIRATTSKHEHDRLRELQCTRDAEYQDGPADAASMALGSKMAPKKTPMSDATIKALIAQGVADALVEYEANKGSGDCDNRHNSGSGERRHVTTTRECTYSDFLKCQPLNFKGTKGFIGLTQWFEKMESVFHIS
ncbi:hypothetical protein Tco_0104911 [Tanacetum coccineum]